MTCAPLERRLVQCAALADTPITVEDHRTIAWHSATFAGDRHDLLVGATRGAALDAWLDGLPAIDLPLPRHLLAELRVTARECDGDRVRVRITGLTVALA